MVNPFKCIPNHFRQEFNSNLPPREPLLFGTAFRAIVLDTLHQFYTQDPKLHKTILKDPLQQY